MNDKNGNHFSSKISYKHIMSGYLLTQLHNRLHYSQTQPRC
jgi:hypothetical protein